MYKILLIGSGGHARSCIDVIESTDKYKIDGLVEQKHADVVENINYPVLGYDEDLENLRKEYSYAFVTVGQIKSAKIRMKLFKTLVDLNFKVPKIISPISYVSKSAIIQKGTIVMHGTIVNSGAKIGENCIINNKALIEHDAVIGNHCHISTGTIINGGVKVGSESFVGSGSVTKQGISIGNNCVIGAGRLVGANVQSNQVIIN